MLKAASVAVQAAYAFKATYQNGGHGLNFSNLHDYNNHWIYVTCVLAVDTVLAILLALYLEQILSSGTGVRRHPLFFLHRRKSAGGSGAAAPKPHGGVSSVLHRRGTDEAQADNAGVKPGRSFLGVLRRQKKGADPAASKVIKVPRPPSCLAVDHKIHDV